MDKYLSGIWPARVTDYGLTDHKGGAQVEVQFAVEFTDAETGQTYEKPMRWWGYMSSDGAEKVTFNALQALGFRGKVASDLASGPEGGLIDVGRQVTLTVIEETYEGILRHKIQWVNSPGGGVGTIKRLSVADAKARMAQVDAHFAAFRAKAGKPTDDIGF